MDLDGLCRFWFELLTNYYVKLYEFWYGVNINTIIDAIYELNIFVFNDFWVTECNVQTIFLHCVQKDFTNFLE